MEDPIRDLDVQMAPLMYEAEPFGEYLRRERLDRQVSLEEICWATKIKVDYLRALEESDVSDLPAEIFVKGYIKSIAQYLEIDPNEAVTRYTRCVQTDCQEVAVVPQRPVGESFVARILNWLDNIKRLLTGREDFQIY